MFEKNLESIEEGLGRALKPGELEIFELCKDNDAYNFYRGNFGQLEARADGNTPINRAGVENPFFSPEVQEHVGQQAAVAFPPLVVPSVSTDVPPEPPVEPVKPIATANKGLQQK